MGGKYGIVFTPINDDLPVQNGDQRLPLTLSQEEEAAGRWTAAGRCGRGRRGRVACVACADHSSGERRWAETRGEMGAGVDALSMVMACYGPFSSILPVIFIMGII